MRDQVFYFVGKSVIEVVNTPSLPRLERSFCFIRDFIASNGFSPTRREMASGLRESGPSVVDHHVKVLKSLGVIKVDRGKSRGMYIVKDFSDDKADQLPKKTKEKKKVKKKNKTEKARVNISITHRTCSDCNERKPVAEMLKDARGKGGYRKLCKQCGRKRYHKKLKNTPEIKARRAVRIAVRSGALAKPSDTSCHICNNRPANQYHHYKGYAPENWLEVEAVCGICHGGEHRSLITRNRTSYV